MPAATPVDSSRRGVRDAVVLGAVVRLAYWLSKWNQELLLNDSLYYSAQARQLADGTWFREVFVDRPGAEHGPLTSILMAPLSWFDDPVRWQRLVTVACGIATVWLIGKVAAHVAGPRVAVTAAFIAALAPNLWMNDGLVMSESVSMMCVVAVLWLALQAMQRPTVSSMAWVGAVAGLGALARSELALLVPLVGGVLVVAQWRRGEHHWRHGVVLVAAAAGVVAPWAAFNLSRFERPVILTTNDGTTWLGANCDDTWRGPEIGSWSLLCVVSDPEYRMDEEPSVRSARQRSLAVQYVRSHLRGIPRVTAARLGRTLDVYGLESLVRQDVGEERPRWAAWLGMLSFWVMVPLTVVGATQLRRSWRWLLCAPFLVVLATTVLFYGGHRIRSTAEPSLVILAAVGIGTMAASLQPPGSGQAHAKRRSA